MRDDNAVRFGPAGNAEDFPYKSSLDAPRWLSELGLNAYEVQCGHGVRIGDVTSEKLGEAARQHDIALSLHAPYFINLGGEGEERFSQNAAYLLASARVASKMGAGRIVVHTGAPGGRDRAEAMETVQTSLLRILKLLEEEGWGDILLCPEVMGKLGQLGTLEEVLTLCQSSDKLLPCVDFGHLYARTHGATDGREAIAGVLDAIESSLGAERARGLHIHFSHIQFGKGGELKHLTLSDDSFGPDHRPLMKLLAERGYHGVVVCESRGTQARDAAELQKTYLLERGGS